MIGRKFKNKKYNILVVFLIFVCSLQAQNIQYVFNTEGNRVITVEHFKPQPNGKFFYFSDFTIDEEGQNNSYTEIFQYWKGFTAQYNFGLNENFKISPVYLFGLSKEFDIKGTNFTFDILYRYENSVISENNILKDTPHNYQISLSYIYSGDKFQVNGFVDYWNLEQLIINGQVWYKLNDNFHVGSKGYLGNFLPNNISFGIKYLVD
jgi:Domain of unknown function (DUF5020)